MKTLKRLAIWKPENTDILLNSGTEITHGRRNAKMAHSEPSGLCGEIEPVGEDTTPLQHKSFINQ